MQQQAPVPSKRFRVALLGTGVIAVPHAAALKSLSDIELIAVCDLDEQKGRAFQQQVNATHYFQDLKTMLERVSPDVVHVLLPPAAHAQAAQSCLAAGSHVFVEKPFCITSEECRIVQETAQRAGRQVGVNHNLTYMPGFLRVLDQIRACRFGAVEHVTGVYNIPIPALATGPHRAWMFTGPEKLLLEIGPHPLSTIYRLLGQTQQATAEASGELTLANGSRFFHSWHNSLVCERGTAQFLLSVGKSYPNTWIHILCEDGEALVDFRRYTVRFSERTKYRRTNDLRDGSSNAWSLLRQSVGNFATYSLAAVGLGSPAYSWQEVSIRNSIAAFYSALASGKPVPVGALEGTAVVETCELLFDSAMRTRERMRETDVGEKERVALG